MTKQKTTPLSKVLIANRNQFFFIVLIDLQKKKIDFSFPFFDWIFFLFFVFGKLLSFFVNRSDIQTRALWARVFYETW